MDAKEYWADYYQETKLRNDEIEPIRKELYKHWGEEYATIEQLCSRDNKSHNKADKTEVEG